MARNSKRKNPQTESAKPDAPKAPVESGEAVSAAASADSEAAQKPAKSSSSGKKEPEVLFQVRTKRTSDIIKAYITFTYRVLHPKVTSRLILYGLLVAVPGIFYFKDIFWKLFFIAIGAALVLLGFFRQYISLAITKKNDPDYLSGAEFTYDFNGVAAVFRKNGEVFSRLTKYKDITAFYYDDNFYYMALAREILILPKKAFTVGEPSDFEEFIYKKSKKTCRWLPDKLSDRIKKRRAERAVQSGDLFK